MSQGLQVHRSLNSPRSRSSGHILPGHRRLDRYKGSLESLSRSNTRQDLVPDLLTKCCVLVDRGQETSTNSPDCEADPEVGLGAEVKR